jgi:predicted  nucleic acid-binding Zn-ribbon protein
MQDEAQIPIEDRVTELERLWPVMVMKLQQYDKFIEDLGTVQKQQDLMQAVVNDQALKITSVKEKQASLEALIAQVKQAQATKHADLASTTDKLVTQHETLIERIKGIGTFVGTHIEACKELFEMIPQVKDMASLLNVAIDTIKALSDGNNELTVKHQGVQASILNMQDQAVQTNSNVQALAAQLSARVQEASSSKAGILGTIDSLATKLEHRLAGIISRFSEDIALVRKNLAAIPTLDSLRTELLAKIEETAVDGSNAVIRATSAAQQVVQLQKKVDLISSQVNAIRSA